MTDFGNIFCNSESKWKFSDPDPTNISTAAVSAFMVSANAERPLQEEHGITQ